MTSPDQHPAVAWRRALWTKHDPADPAYLDSPAKTVAGAMAEHVDKAGMAWPGADRLAGVTGLGLRTVRDRLKMLEQRGWFEVVERGGRSGGPRASVVRITVPPTMVEGSTTRAGDALVTDQTRAGDAPVTRAGDALVNRATRASHDTTRASHDSTRAGDAPQLEELEEQEQQREPDRRARRLEVAEELGRRAAQRRKAESPAAYAAGTARAILADSGQLAAIDAAIAAHPEAPTSSVADAVEAPPPPSAPGRRPEYRSEPACATCEDRGVLDVDPTKNLATRCPDCSIQAAVVA